MNVLPSWLQQASADLQQRAAHMPGFLILVMLVFIALLSGLDALCKHLAQRGPAWAYWCKWARIYARLSVLILCAVFIYWRLRGLLG